MAVDDVRLESDDRKRGKSRLGEESKLLQVIEPVSVGFRSAEVGFVVDEIEGHTVLNIFQNADVALLAVIVHIEVIQVFEFEPDLFGNAHIFRYDNPDVKILFVKTLRKRSGDIRQSPGLDERDSFRRNKQYILHKISFRYFHFTDKNSIAQSLR